MPLIYKSFLAGLSLFAGVTTAAWGQQPEAVLGTPPTVATQADQPATSEPLAPAAGPAGPAAERGVSLNRVVAVVNDGIVLQSALDQQVQMVTMRLQQAGQQMPPRDILRQQVLERLVLQEIQLQRADRAGIKVSDEQLNQTLTEVAVRNNVKFSDLPAALESQGINYRTYREEIRQEMILGQLRQRDVYSRIYISPREVDQCIAKALAAAGGPARIRCRARPGRHPGLGNAAAGRGTYGACPGRVRAREARRGFLRPRGLLLGCRHGPGRRQARLAQGWKIPTVLADLVAGLQAGGVSEPLRTPSGYHIVRLNEVRGADVQTVVQQVRARHILLKPTEIQDDATVEQRLRTVRERIAKGEDFAAVAQGALRGPGLGVRGGATSAGRARAPSCPSSRRNSRRCPRDQISQPFRTQFGWHIIQLLGRRTCDAVEDTTRQQVRASRCASHAPTRKRSSGCAASATRRTSNTASEPYRYGPTLAVTSGEPAGIGPDLCAAIASKAWKCRVDC